MNNKQDMPREIWVKENDDDTIQCHFVADLDKYIFTDYDDCVKFTRTDTIITLEDLPETIEEDRLHQDDSDFARGYNAALDAVKSLMMEKMK